MILAVVDSGINRTGKDLLAHESDSQISMLRSGSCVHLSTNVWLRYLFKQATVQYRTVGEVNGCAVDLRYCQVGMDFRTF